MSGSHSKTFWKKLTPKTVRRQQHAKTELETVTLQLAFLVTLQVTLGLPSRSPPIQLLIFRIEALDFCGRLSRWFECTCWIEFTSYDCCHGCSRFVFQTTWTNRMKVISRSKRTHGRCSENRLKSKHTKYRNRAEILCPKAEETCWEGTNRTPNNCRETSCEAHLRPSRTPDLILPSKKQAGRQSNQVGKPEFMCCKATNPKTQPNSPKLTLV